MFQIASSRDPPPIPDHLSPQAKDFLLMCFNRVARDRAFGSMVRLRLLLKGSLTELYVNDLLMQCYSLPAAADGRLGVLGSAAFSHLRAWTVRRPAER
jgi:hypothetical protein